MVNLTFEVEEDPGVIGVPVQLGLDLWGAPGRRSGAPAERFS